MRGIKVLLKKKDPQFVDLTISDTGLGIPAKEIPKIFRKYEQVKNPKQIKGTGLGLPIVKEIAEAHKGRIHVESAVGEGTTFSISLRSAHDN